MERAGRGGGIREGYGRDGRLRERGYREEVAEGE